ncbi:MAG: AAA family ATPase [Candidatus Marinimicrobia bacterium]|nr:AAA family ATPase [Candidatus Neomarinimicrobiota bacterium]
MRFTRINFSNWRNFRKVEIKLQKRAFIVGPNAAGKSNLLDAFRFLQDIASVGGGLQQAVNKRDGVSKIRCLAARRAPQVILEIDIGANDSENPDWTYRLEIVQDRASKPVVEKEIVERFGEVILSRPDKEDESDPERLRQTHLEQVNANKQFREISEFLNTVRYLHIVPQLVREPDRSTGKVNDPYGGDFLERLARTPKSTLESRLNKIRTALRVAVPQLKDLELVRDNRGTPHIQGLYEHWRPNAGWQTEDQFSDGTLRLLGLLWSVLEGTGPLLLEEPELSLHPELIRHVPQMFARLSRKRGRQVFISTHSGDLLQDSGIDANEVLLLLPSYDGTRVITAQDDDQIVALLENGDLSIADAVLPRTSPSNASQIALFGD